MRYRRFGRTNWQVSEIGYGMWGMADWTGSDDLQSLASLQLAVDLGCNFFDTAYAYGEGHSESLLGKLVRANPDKQLYTATKIPPKNRTWPSQREFRLDDCFPPDYIEEMVHRSLENSGLDGFDLMQFHVWEDHFVDDDRWAVKMDDLKRQGLIRAVGISLNRWEPWNGVRTVESGLVDAVQAVYNIFDQNPEDKLLPTCAEHDVAVIARVPFDEGSLTGKITLDSSWPEGDWRNKYFAPEKLKPTLENLAPLRRLVPEELTMAEMALRFILNEERIQTSIPGMRQPVHVRANMAASEAGPLPDGLYQELRTHRWDRDPLTWPESTGVSPRREQPPR